MRKWLVGCSLLLTLGCAHDHCYDQAYYGPPPMYTSGCQPVVANSCGTPPPSMYRGGVLPAGATTAEPPR